MSLLRELIEARLRVHLQIDAQGEKALRVIRSMGERDRRAIGQMTRFDHLQRAINRRTQ